MIFLAIATICTIIVMYKMVEEDERFLLGAAAIIITCFFASWVTFGYAQATCRHEFEQYKTMYEELIQQEEIDMNLLEQYNKKVIKEHKYNSDIIFNDIFHTDNWLKLEVIE